MDERYNQFLNAYRLSVQLLRDKKNYSDKFIDEFGTIERKLQKMDIVGIKKFIEYLLSEDISEVEKEKKILNTGKRVLGGLSNTERMFLLEAYLMRKGTLRKQEFEGTISKLHETIIKLVSLIMQANSWIKNELNIHPQVRLIQSLSALLPQMENYKEILKMQDYYLAQNDTYNFYRQLEQEKILNEKIDGAVVALIQGYNNQVEGIKQSMIEKYLPNLGLDISYFLRLGFTTMLLVLVMYASAVPSNPGGGSEKSTARENLVNTFRPIFPTDVKHKISSLFGARIISRGSKYHKGIDIGCPTGTKIYAVADGTIKFSRGRDFGKYIRITHNNGLASIYAHLSRFVSGVKSGDTVKQGALIGYSGNTGASVHPHVHFEIRIVGGAENEDDEIRIDPLEFYATMLSTLRIKEETIPWAQKESYNKFKKLKGE